MNYPVEMGADALFTYGSDGSLTARLCGDKIGIRFETVMGCTLTLDFGQIVKTEYEVVMPDWIRGSVYTDSEKTDFEIMAVSHQSVYIGADRVINIRAVFDADVICEKSESCNTYMFKDETLALYISENGGFSAGVAMGYGCTERARDTAMTDVNKRRDGFIKKYSAQVMPKGIYGRYEQVYRRCLALTESNMFSDGDTKVFAERTAHGLCINSRHAMLLAVGTKNIYPEVALDTVRYLAGFVDEKGILPVSIRNGFSDGGCAAPLLPWAFNEIAGYDKALVKEYYDILRRHIMYFINERDMNKNSLYHWLAGNGNNPGFDSGMENSPRFDEGVIVDGADLGAYLYMSVDAMCTMSKLINENNDVLYWNVIAERIRLGVNDFLYDEGDKFYYDRGVIGKKHNKIKTIAGFVPVFGGVCTPVRLNAMIAHLSDKSTFGARYGVPSVALNEKLFESDFYRGAVCFEENYKLAYGLLKAGKRDKAAEIVSRCLEAACRGYETAGVIYEYYNPFSIADTSRQKRKGAGGGSMAIYGYNTCRRDCSASAGFLVAMLELLRDEV